MEYLDIGFRSLFVYLFMMVGLRVFGKSQLSQLNAGDVILLLLISNAVQNAMVGPNTSLDGGIFAATVLFLANYLVKKVMFQNEKVKIFIESESIILVRDGVLMEAEMKKSEISTDEINEAIREHGIEKIEDVKLLILEVDGNISVISTDKNNQTHYSKHRRKKMKHYN
ncbi:MAG: DUF421 domain-containing protein [Sulfuricurvum sp.]|uniref:DUF421 domain-containing protein n=1 Tax=Sulfuricurvum sp. TaxID=2025608 RepID=UPI0025CCB986|nr:YetF domain-containing protein [Sulfuricurvum sp.]MCI4406882.1 DUF421 domain-containing protein [Sulfuricurvum sp.]